jgi:hypothetical protein
MEQWLIDLANQRRVIGALIAHIHLPERQDLPNGVVSVMLKRLVG